MEKIVRVQASPQNSEQNIQPPSSTSGQENQSVLRSFSGPKNKKNKMKKLITPTLALLIIIAGIGSGWGLSRISANANSSNPNQTDESTKESKTEAGMENSGQFSDEAEGVLMEGGYEGEGTHYLDRGLGPEKNVYLTSTVINLQNFVGKKVKVWGNTLSAQKVGWLMDVGRIKVSQ